jgi:hypothetical protein
MSHNGLPDAWTTENTPVSTMFNPSTTTSPIVPTKSPPLAARPTRIHLPTLPAQIQNSGSSGSISIVATPDEFANLISALNRATGQHQSQVRLTQDPIALGLIGFGLVLLTGIGGYAIASMSAQSPAAQQKAELDRIERISARESAATRKIAEKAAENRSICVFSLSCPGGR